MKRLLIIGLILILFSFGTTGQDIRERLFVNVSQSTLVSGDRLHFSAFVLSDSSGLLSQVSKIIYVQLIGQEGVVDQQKIANSNGLAEGSIFINTQMSTGQYHLVVYTRWMRNFDDRYVVPLTIINPFEKYGHPEPQAPQSIQITTMSKPGVAGLQNEFGYFVPFDIPPKYSVKILDEAGELIHDFDGLGNAGRFKFKPLPNQSYQMVLEGNGKFWFADLPKLPNTGYAIDFIEQPNQFLINYNSNVDAVNSSLRIEVVTSSGTRAVYPVSPSNAVYLNKKEWGGQMLWIGLASDDGILATYHHLPVIKNQITSEDRPIYAPRTHVSKKFKLPEGIYSIVVRKEDQYLKHAKVSAHQSEAWFNLTQPLSLQTELIERLKNGFGSLKSPIIEFDEVELLPESRGELIQIDLKSQASSKDWLLSFPGSPFQLVTGKALDDKTLLFHFNSPYTDRKAYLMRPGDDSMVEAHVENKFIYSEEDFQFETIRIDSIQMREVVKRSIDNQVQNIFSPTRTSVSLDKWIPQFREFRYDYHLDDYNRFPKLSDYFVEYIKGVTIKKKQVSIYKEDRDKDLQSLPTLVLLDGLPVDPKGVLEYNPKLIEDISIIDNYLFMGSTIFDGVIDMKTYTGDLPEFDDFPVAKSMEVIGLSPLAEKNAITGYAHNDKRPDRRHKLYWSAHKSLEDGELKVDFQTSDVVGDYVIEIEGFDITGQSVSLTSTFKVLSEIN